MTLYDNFLTSQDKEINGFVFEYPLERPTDRITLACADVKSANVKVAAASDKYMGPYRAKFKNNTLGETKTLKIMYKIYAEAVVLDWETLVNGKWVKGIPSLKGKKYVPFTKENVYNLFVELPRVFEIVSEQAVDIQNYLVDRDEDKEMGNSEIASDGS